MDRLIRLGKDSQTKLNTCYSPCLAQDQNPSLSRIDGVVVVWGLEAPVPCTLQSDQLEGEELRTTVAWGCKLSPAYCTAGRWVQTVHYRVWEMKLTAHSLYCTTHSPPTLQPFSLWLQGCEVTLLSVFVPNMGGFFVSLLAVGGQNGRSWRERHTINKWNPFWT